MTQRLNNPRNGHDRCAERWRKNQAITQLEGIQGRLVPSDGSARINRHKHAPPRKEVAHKEPDRDRVSGRKERPKTEKKEVSPHLILLFPAAMAGGSLISNALGSETGTVAFFVMLVVTIGPVLGAWNHLRENRNKAKTA